MDPPPPPPQPDLTKLAEKIRDKEKQTKNRQQVQRDSYQKMESRQAEQRRQLEIQQGQAAAAQVSEVTSLTGQQILLNLQLIQYKILTLEKTCQEQKQSLMDAQERIRRFETNDVINIGEIMFLQQLIKDLIKYIQEKTSLTGKSFSINYYFILSYLSI